MAAEKYVNISSDSVKTVKKELQLVGVRYEAGGALKSDVLSLKVALARAEEDLIRARNNHSLSVSSLANLMGLDPDRPISLAGDQQVPIKVAGGPVAHGSGCGAFEIPAAIGCTDENLF